MVSSIAKSIAVLGIGLSLTLTGCMVSPAFQSSIPTKTEKVLFEGYTNKPNQVVTIYAVRASDSQWIKIGETKTSGSSFASPLGGDWYGWNTKIVIPASCWKTPNFWAPFAEVKAVVDGEMLATFDEGFYGYVGQYDSLVELYEDHGHASTARVYSQQP